MPDFETSRTLRAISVALWVIATVMTIELGIYIFQLLTSPSTDEYLAAGQEIAERHMGEDNSGFHQMDLETLVEEAAVIVHSEYEDRGDKLICRVKEVLKGREISGFSVGEELRLCTRFKKKDTHYGEGSIHFFSDRDTSPSYSASIHRGHLPGLENVPLEKLKSEVQAVDHDS